MTEELVVTKVTENAAAPETLTDEDYRDIYNELRGFHADTGLFDVTLGQFKQQIGSTVSRAAWWNYDTGKLALSRKMRNELRAVVKQPLLPPTLEDTVADLDPNATVFQIGDEKPQRVLLFSDQVPLWIYADNGVLTATHTMPTNRTGAPPRPRKPVKRLWVTKEQIEAQERLGVDWKEIINAGIEAMINKSNDKGSDSQKGDLHE